MEEISSILVVMALCTTKFLFGLAGGIVNLHSQDWNFFTYFLSTVGGGMVGVIAYDLLLMEIVDFIRKKKGIEKRFKMNKKMRRLVKLRSKFGLIGIVAITPVLLQVPLGTILAGTIESNTKKVALYMFISFSFYAILFFGLDRLFGFNPSSLIDALQFWK